MTSLDFMSFASRIADESGNRAMVPVIEKELLHYEILGALDRAGLLDSLVFQGGTCLRLCYGAVRFSEDLDFAGGRRFDFENISAIKEVLEKSLADRYAVESTVTESAERTDESGVSVKRWQVKVVTAPERPDIPLQRISLEVASVPAHTKAARALHLNYEELPVSYRNVILRAETLEEICADKLKAFLTAGHLRYRDLWDMNWIVGKPGIDRSALPELFHQKLADYGQAEAARQNAHRVAEIPAIIESKEFLGQLRRFIPVADLAATLERPIYREAMATELQELYRFVL